MNKLTSTILASLSLLIFAGCAGSGNNTTTPTTQPTTGSTVVEPAQVTVEPIAPEVTFVTITDFNGNVVDVPQNPTTVAIYDFGILDMLYTIGFERTGIETLILPNPDGLPDILSYFRDGNSNVNVINGGTLFYIDWDVLDIVTPEVVIKGVRSFGMNAAGDRLNAEDREAFTNSTLERYSDTAFFTLSINTNDSDILNDMRRNAYVLAQIFPGIGDDLNAEIEKIEADMRAIAEVTSNSDMRAIFVMMTQPTTLSVFLEDSRFDFMYEEFGFNSIEMDLTTFTDQHGFDARAEFLLEHNPDIIFLLDRTEPETGLGAATENFLNDPIIQRTNAFINGHIYSELPMAEWYTVVGGFQAARRMIADVNRFIEAYTSQQ
ncbi:MAG: ABC transporter substrate-binding protein [Defluviitaleaceae bacterium]|nr:ABC transporter substrate-binding protein [Defluviitaleaceae bacterium]